MTLIRGSKHLFSAFSTKWGITGSGREALFIAGQETQTLERLHAISAESEGRL